MTFAPRDPSAIGVAVLGAGRMGLTHLRNLAAIPNARIVVVADPDAEAAATGRDLARADRASTDPLEAIHDPAVEAVVIVTPTSTHAALIEAALRAGKAVWSEKPIAQDLGETARIVDLWRETGIPVQLGFMRRFDPGYERAKELIDAGELGRIEQFRALFPRHVPAAARVPADGRRLVPRHGRPRPRPGAVPGRGGGGGPRVGRRPVRRPFRAGRRLRHGGRDAPVPQRRPGRRRDGPPLRVGLRHPDRGRRGRGQGGRRRRAEDARRRTSGGSAPRATCTRASRTGSRSPTAASSRRSSRTWPPAGPRRPGRTTRSRPCASRSRATRSWREGRPVRVDELTDGSVASRAALGTRHGCEKG